MARVLLFFHVVSREPTARTLVVVLVAQEFVFAHGPFLIKDKEEIITEDYAARRVTQLDKRPPRSLDEIVAVSVLARTDLGTLAP